MALMLLLLPSDHRTVSVQLGLLLHPRVVLLRCVVVLTVVNLVEEGLVAHAQHLRLEQRNVGSLILVCARVMVVLLLILF